MNQSPWSVGPETDRAIVSIMLDTLKRAAEDGVIAQNQQEAVIMLMAAGYTRHGIMLFLDYVDRVMP